MDWLRGGGRGRMTMNERHGRTDDDVQFNCFPKERHIACHCPVPWPLMHTHVCTQRVAQLCMCPFVNCFLLRLTSEWMDGWMADWAYYEPLTYPSIHQRSRRILLQEFRASIGGAGGGGLLHKSLVLNRIITKSVNSQDLALNHNWERDRDRERG